MNNMNFYGLKKTNNLSYVIFSFLFISSYIKNRQRCLWLKKQTNYFVSNSIIFNLYKKNLSKNHIGSFLTSTKEKKNNLLSSTFIPNFKRHINFGKLTWYWVFRTISQNRFLLYYKEHKNYYSNINIIRYEKNLLNYEKNYNKWSKLVNLHIKNYDENIFSSKMNKVLKKLYLFRLKINKVEKLSKQTTNKKTLYLTNEKLIHKNSYLRYYRKPFVKRVFFGGIYKRFWKSKKFRIIGLKKWRILTSSKSKKNDNKKKNSVLTYNLTKSLFNILKKNKNFKQSLWIFSSSKNKYLKDISNSFSRQNLINNPLKLKGIISNFNLLKKNNNIKLKNALTSYIFPKNSIDLTRKEDFSCIIFSNKKKQNKKTDYNENKINYNTGINFTYLSINKKFKNIFIKKENNYRFIKEKNIKKNIFIKKKYKNLKIIDSKRYSYLNKKIENIKLNILNKIKLQKNIKNKNKNNTQNIILKNKIFISFLYNSKIKLKFLSNNIFNNMLISRLKLNKKRLNQLITNIFFNNFSIRFYYKIYKEKIISIYSRNARNNYVKFLLNLNKFNSLRSLKTKNKIKKKKLNKEQYGLVIKKKKLDKFKKEYSWSLHKMEYEDALKKKKFEILNEKKKFFKLKVVYNKKSKENQIRLTKKTIMRFGNRNFKRFSIVSCKNIFRPMLGYGNKKKKNLLVLKKKYNKINIIFLSKLKNYLININKINNSLKIKNYNKFNFLFLKLKKKIFFKKYFKFLNYNIKKKIKIELIDSVKKNIIKKKNINNYIYFFKKFNKNYTKSNISLKNNKIFKKKIDLKLTKLSRRVSVLKYSNYLNFENYKTRWIMLNKKIKKNYKLKNIIKKQKFKKKFNNKIIKKNLFKKVNLYYFFNASTYYKKKYTLNVFKNNKMFKKRIKKLYTKNKVNNKIKLDFKNFFNIYKEFTIKKLKNKIIKNKKITFLSSNRSFKLTFLLKKKKYKLLKNFDTISFYLKKYKSIKNNKSKNVKNSIFKIKKISKKLKNLTRDVAKSSIELNRDFFFIFSLFEKIKKKKLIKKTKESKNLKLIGMVPYFIKKNKNRKIFMYSKHVYNCFVFVNNKKEKTFNQKTKNINNFLSVYSNKFRMLKNYSFNKLLKKRRIQKNNSFLNKKNLLLKKYFFKSKKFPITTKRKSLKFFSFYKNIANGIYYDSLKLFKDKNKKKYKIIIKNYPPIPFGKLKNFKSKLQCIRKFKKNNEFKNSPYLMKKNYIKKNKKNFKLKRVNKKSQLDYAGSIKTLNSIFKKKNLFLKNKYILKYKPIISYYYRIALSGGMGGLKNKLISVKKKNVLKIFINKNKIKKKYEKTKSNFFLKNKIRNIFFKKKISSVYNLNILLNFKEIFKYKTEYLKIKKNILKKNYKKNIDLKKFKNYKIAKLTNSSRILYLKLGSDNKSLKKISKIKKYNFVISKKNLTFIKNKKIYLKKLEKNIKNSYTFFKKKKFLRLIKWSVFKKLKKFNQMKMRQNLRILSDLKKEKLLKNNNIKICVKNLKNLNIKSNIQKKLKFDLDLFLKKISKKKSLNKKSRIVLSKSKKNIRKKITVFIEKITKSLIKNKNIKKERFLLKKKYTFLGYRYLKKKNLVKRIRLKKINLINKNAINNKKNKTQHNLNLKLWTVFYKKLTKSFKISIISKKNKHIWRKRLFPITKIFKKKLYDLKSKNRLTHKRWRGFGKRWLPKKWYRVRRRKFPLKSQKKDWSLKITKHYNLLYWRSLRKYTTYDSSFSYYRFLSIRGKQSKKKKLYINKKLNGRSEHLLYYPWKFKPNFLYHKKFKKKTGIKYMTSKRLFRLNIFNKTHNNPIKTFYTPSAESISNYKQKIKNFTNNRVQGYYSKNCGIYASIRYKLCSEFINKWQNKINIKLSRGFFFDKKIESIKQHWENDLDNSKNKLKLKKFSYMSKICGFSINLDKNLLIKSLIYKNTCIFTKKIFSTFSMPIKTKILRKGLFRINLIKILKRRMDGSGYISLKDPSSFDFFSTKLKNFYKISKIYYYKNVSKDNYGYMQIKQKNYSFIDISFKKNIKFKHLSNTYFKKNKWLINSFEVRGSTILNIGKNI